MTPDKLFHQDRKMWYAVQDAIIEKGDIALRDHLEEHTYTQLKRILPGSVDTELATEHRLLLRQMQMLARMYFMIRDGLEGWNRPCSAFGVETLPKGLEDPAMWRVFCYHMSLVYAEYQKMVPPGTETLEFWDWFGKQTKP